jgi:ComEC/Rec2-related protein
MILSSLFAFFLEGLLVSDPSNHPHLRWLEPIVLLPALGYMAFVTPSKFRIFWGCAIAFIFGIIWITWLPTWPEPLSLDRFAPGQKYEVRGRAICDPIEIGTDDYLPVYISSYRKYFPEDATTYIGPGIYNGNWIFTKGTVVIKVPWSTHVLPGAEYRAKGILRIERELLNSSGVLRFMPRGMLYFTDENDGIVLTGAPSPFKTVLNALRYRLISHLSWGTDPIEGELINGITLGYRNSSRNSDWSKDFYNAGLSHLIVASGAQLSLLFMPFLFLLGRIKVRSSFLWVLLFMLGAILIIAAQLFGSEPSIERASIMGCMLLLSMGLKRRTFGLASLSAVGLFWLIKNPLLSRDAGFMLSMGASFGIVHISPPIMASWNRNTPLAPITSRRGPHRINELAIYQLRLCIRFLVACSATTLTAQLGVLPVLASMLGRISAGGFLANLPAVPLGQLVLILGALSGIAGFANPAFSIGINKMIAGPVSALLVVAHDFASLPYANSQIQPLPMWIMVPYYAVLVILVESRHFIKPQRKVVLAVLKSRPTQPAIKLDLDSDTPVPE